MRSSIMANAITNSMLQGRVAASRDGNRGAQIGRGRTRICDSKSQGVESDRNYLLQALAVLLVLGAAQQRVRPHD